MVRQAHHEGVASELPVTAHAVLRYITRVLDRDLRPIAEKLGPQAGNRAVAEAACAAIGVSFRHIQEKILPPHLVSVVQAGAARVKREGMVLHCTGGNVVTLYTSERHGKRKAFSEREIRKHHQRMARRCK